MLNVADLRAQYLQYITTAGDEARARSTIGACWALDFALESWFAARFENEPRSAEAFMVSEALCTDDMNGGHRVRSDHNVATRAQYLCLRLIVHNIMASHLEMLAQAKAFSADEMESKQCHKSIARLSQDLCHSIGNLASVDGNALGEKLQPKAEQMEPQTAWLCVWPLTIAASIECIPQPQKDWLQTKLDLVMRVLGNTTLSTVH